MRDCANMRVYALCALRGRKRLNIDRRHTCQLLRFLRESNALSLFVPPARFGTTFSRCEALIDGGCGTHALVAQRTCAAAFTSHQASLLLSQLELSTLCTLIGYNFFSHMISANHATITEDTPRGSYCWIFFVQYHFCTTISSITGW